MENEWIELVKQAKGFVDSLAGWQIVCLSGLILWVIGMLAGLGKDEAVSARRTSACSARWVVDARKPSNETSGKILEVSDIVESRQHGRNEGEDIRVVLPPERVVARMDADVRRSIDWIKREGAGYGVEVGHEDE